MGSQQQRATADAGDEQTATDSQSGAASDAPDPWIAAVLSVFVPGLGHLYAGDVTKAVKRFGHYLIACWGGILIWSVVLIPLLTVLTGGLGAVLYLLVPGYLLLYHLGSGYEAYDDATAGETETGDGSDEVTQGSSSSGGTGGQWPPADAATVESLSYRDLQQHAKDAGIRADRTRSELVADLCREYGLEAGYTERPDSRAELESYSYRELQQLAKEHGIKANQKTAEMQADVAEALDLPEESDDEGG